MTPKRPGWLDSDLLGSLIDEAEVRLAERALSVGSMWYAPPGPVARGVSRRSRVRNWVADQVGRPIGGATGCVYLGYRSGDACRVQVDSLEEFAFNLLVCLHLGGARRSSVPPLTLYEGGRRRRIPMAAGDCFVFSASNTPHGRAPLPPGTRLLLLSVGFTDAVYPDEVRP